VVVDPATLSLTVSAPSNAKTGTWNVRVTNTDGSSGLLSNGLTVLK
jgi:hypothetical protein